MKTEMNGEFKVDQESPVKPQIKQPSESRHRRREERDVTLEEGQISNVTSPIAAGPDGNIHILL